MDLRLLQLADSGFPSGAFAHSGGLEGLRALGLLPDGEALRVRLVELTWHGAFGALPFLTHAHQRDAVEADRRCDVFLSSHVANRASRAQGRAFLMAVREAFGDAGPELPFAHAPVAFGAALARARVSLDDARLAFLFGAVRNALSAAVRLGVVGPLEAQRLFTSVHPVVQTALQRSAQLTLDDARGTAVLLDTAQLAQDRLYSRLFQS